MRLRTTLLVLLLPAFLAGCGAERSPAPETASSETVPPSTPAPAGAERLQILVLGNSLAAGLGVEPEEAFPSLLQAKIDSLGWPFRITNAGVSGETSSAGLSRIDWLLNRPVDILILELGANDGLRGIPPEVTERNLQAIIDRTKTRYPDVHIVLAGMEAPPNMGQAFTSDFRQIFPTLAARNEALLIPFLLEDVAGDPELNQADGIHPTPAGHRIIAQHVWEVLEPLLKTLHV